MAPAQRFAWHQALPPVNSTASRLAPAVSSHPTIVEVRQSTQPLSALDRSGAIGTGLCPQDQTIAEALVVSLVMIMLDKFVDGFPQGAFSEQNHLFQAGFLDGSDKSLCVSIQVRGAWRQLNRLHSGALQDLYEFRREQGIAVMDQVSLANQESFPASFRLRAIWLIQNPLASRVKPAISTLRLDRSIKKNTRNLVKPLRVQASIVKKSAATITSRCRDKNSFQVVFRPRSEAGSRPCSLRI